MKQIAKILNTTDKGQLVVILFESVKLDKAKLEFTFHDDDLGGMVRHDMEFESRSAAITLFHDLDDNNFLLVNRELIRDIDRKVKEAADEKQRHERECKTIQ